MAIDLHMHTTWSDGTMSPEELVLHAKENGLSTIAITDHDIVDGNADAIRYGEKYGVNVVPGVELSLDVSLPNNGHMHMLGLFIDLSVTSIADTLNYLREERDKRNHKILATLKELKMPLSMEELLEEAGEGSVGRPHIAKLMHRHGYVQSYQEAFDLYLKKGAPAYLEKMKLGAEEGLNLIREARGLAILAHPVTLGYENIEDTKNKIRELKEMGLHGFEVYYSLHSAEFTAAMEQFAADEGFLISGGSDFHGGNKPDIRIRYGKGNLDIPDSVYENLKTAHRAL